jgi:NAD(P)-dependent dehydrogenase (short-subunit alcohol dehydrogenase family)
MTERNVALVTGGSRGIGRGIALTLAEVGYDIAINHLDPDNIAAEQTIEEIKAKGVDAYFWRGDISSPADRSTLIGNVKKTYGKIDVLVNNAGVAPLKRVDILDATEESFDRLITINLKGPYFLTQSVANWMIEEREADPDMFLAVVNISSMSAYTSSTTRGEYCISKAGVSMATKLWADRLSEYGIMVYEIQPGIISTDMTATAKEKYDRMIAEGLTPQKRWGSPEDIGYAVAAIAQGYFPFSTGQVFNIDGGFHLRRL